MTAEARLIARISVPMTSRFFEANGHKMHCMVAGSGPPLVLIHGLNIGWGQWYAVLAQLAQRHTVYALDLPGAGAVADIDFLSTDIAELLLSSVDGALRTLVPEGAVVIGHSTGAWATLKLAAEGHPSIRAVIAVSPVGFTDFVVAKFRPLALRPLAKLIAAKAMPPTRANLEKFLKDVMAKPSTLTPEFVEYVVDHVARPPLTHPLLFIHRLFTPFRFRPAFILSAEELAAIRCPVTIVHGALDPLLPLKTVREGFGRVPNVQVVVLERVGHVPPIERPDDFVRIIEETPHLSAHV